MSERSAADEARIADLTCVVTGAASERGIGRGVALALARQGRPLALLDLDQAGLATAADAARAAGSPHVVTARVDVADEASVDALPPSSRESAAPGSRTRPRSSR